LGVVFEITEKIAHLHEPVEIESAVLRCYQEMLRAGVILIASGDALRTVDCAPGFAALASKDQQAIHAALREAIERVTHEGPSTRITIDATNGAASGGWHALVSRFRRQASDTEALIALRPASRVGFDTGDELVSETVLAYGGHILRNAIMVRRIQDSALETVCAFANAVDARDAYTRGHCERVGWLARRLGEELGLARQQLDTLEWSGIVHDVGKIGVPEEVLNKPGRLTEEEFAHIRRHPKLGYDVLKPISSLEPVLEGVLYHHENYDGSGYPEGVRGQQIPLIARILRIVDTFDALTSSRSYRAECSIAKALDIITGDAGKAFDPQLSDRFVELVRRYVAQRDIEFAERFGHLLRAVADSEIPEPCAL
jgi:HD-GYP domain-containing protein (c-di-GMP phosphodiesterase class II)